MGGTHLPDVTLISPVFYQSMLCGFVANRAHHANIGSESPGSMPISSRLDEEGMLLSPQLLLRDDELVTDLWQRILDDLGDSETQGDFLAQIAANRRGIERLTQLIDDLGIDVFAEGLTALNNYGENLARSEFAKIPQGTYQSTERMDDDGQGLSLIHI